MINNDVRKTGNFGNVIYDSDTDAPTGRKRIGISATEIEFLDDLPPSTRNGLTNNANTISHRTRGSSTQIPPTSSTTSPPTTTKQNNYQTLVLNREQPNGTVIYQSGDNQQLNSAVDHLLEKYAPDAIPQNILNTPSNHQGPTQVNVITTRDPPPVSTFQATIPPASTATHNYSTVIRPNVGQTSQAPAYNGDSNVQISTHPRPTTNYDSFQHAIPPTQQQQHWQPQQSQQQQQNQHQQQWRSPPQQQKQQQWQPSQKQSQKPVSVKTKNGHVAQVVPGKIYTLDDDPLHLLYDRQPSVQPSAQKSSFNTVFQPGNRTQPMPNPSTVMYTNTSQRYPQQPMTTTANPNVQGMQPFNLETLIKRVQQDYLREIQPFVSSVKFVEKDREYGQSLADIGFVTPVTIRKGFSKQADDILRRSFGRQGHSQPPSFGRDDDNTYSDDSEEDDVSDLHPRRRYHRPLEKDDSKQSFTSVTSTSTKTSVSDYDEQYITSNPPRNRVDVYNRGTSPPAQYNAAKPEEQNIPRASIEIPSINVDRNKSDDEDTTTVSGPPMKVNPARRVGSEELSDTSSDSTISDDEESRAAYNEHELSKNYQDNPANAIHALAARVPTAKPDDVVRERINNNDNQTLQRSSDIHPIPPTIGNTQPPNNQGPTENNIKKDHSRGSESDDDDTESEEDQSSATPKPSTNRPPGLEITSIPPLTRGNTTPQLNARFPAPPTNPNSTSIPETNARFPATSTTPNPNNNTRDTARTGANANPYSGQQDSRGAANNRTGPSSATTQPTPTTDNTPTGSGRLFRPDNNSRLGAKRGSKEAQTSFGNKIKSLFRRKHAE